MTRPDCADVTDVIHELDSGNVHQDLDDMLHEVVRAVLDTRKAGSVSLKLDIKLNERGSQLVVKGTVSGKVPRKAVESTLFFANEDGDLSRDNPKQTDIKDIIRAPAEERSLPVGDKTVREVR